MPQFFISHEQNGYRAKVTIEWAAPDGVELLPERASSAEMLADDSLGPLVAAPLDIVLAMQGRSRKT